MQQGRDEHIVSVIFGKTCGFADLPRNEGGAHLMLRKHRAGQIQRVRKGKQQIQQINVNFSIHE
jgi:hypothetical protein